MENNFKRNGTYCLPDSMIYKGMRGNNKMHGKEVLDQEMEGIIFEYILIFIA